MKARREEAVIPKCSLFKSDSSIRVLSVVTFHGSHFSSWFAENLTNGVPLFFDVSEECHRFAPYLFQVGGGGNSA